MNSTDTYLCRSMPRGDDRAYLDDVESRDSYTDSGVPMNHRAALRLNPVWSAVQAVSGDISKIPLSTYQRRPDISDRARELAKDHPAQTIVRWRANPFMSAFRFWRRMMTHLLLWNRAYAAIERDEQYRPIGLYPLLPDRTVGHWLNGQRVYLTEVDGRLEVLDDGLVLDLEGMQLSDEPFEELDLVRNARDSFALALAAEKFNSKFFKNGANCGGVLTVPPEFSDTAANNLLEGVIKKHSRIDNSFKTLILRDGAKWTSTQVNPEQSQLLASRQEAVRDVARWYGLPPHKLGDSAKASYSSLEQENRSYLDSTLQPWLLSISSQCWMKLLSKAEQDSGLVYFEHDPSKFLAVDTATQYTIAEIGLRAGILCPDEVRASLNMNPRPDGMGGQYYYSNNMQEPTTTPEPDQDEPTEPVATEEPSPTADTQNELLEATRALYLRSEQRLQDRVRTTLARSARKRPDELVDVEEIRSQYVADLAEYAGPLAMLTSDAAGAMAQRSADRLLAGVTDATKTHEAAEIVFQNMTQGG